MFAWEDLDLSQPINWAHPLNRGRIAWWLVDKQRYGSPKWYDLVSGNPAVLSSFTAGNGWNTASNPGGAGSIKFNNAAKLTTSVPVQSALTFACWAQRLTGGGSYGTLFAFSGSLGWYVLSSGKVEFYPEATSTTTLAVGTWYHLAVTIDSTGAGKYYINGVQDATTFSYSNTPRVWQYLGTDGGGDNYIGYLNDFAVWNRALSASEINWLYTSSREGYAGVLNWLSPEALDILLSSSSGTYLSLAALSAAWTNPSVSLASSLGLSLESAAWNDPAVSLESLLDLAAQSAAWNDSPLSVSSTLALGSESATWNDPALALALALAVGQQSATWTNPALATPTPSSALPLPALSATWTNPGLAVASYLALAAESASWTNPLLNEAVALALTGQSCAWNNPALTPGMSQGVVVQLPADSALWNVAPLGLFFCPTVLNPYFGLEWLVVVPGLPALARESCVISNTEQVTLYRKTADGSFDGGTLVGQALRLDAMKDGTINAGAAKRKKELDWYMWASQTGNPEVKDGDYILDSSGNKWVIWNTDVQAWGNRYFVKTKLAQ